MPECGWWETSPCGWRGSVDLQIWDFAVVTLPPPAPSLFLLHQEAVSQPGSARFHPLSHMNLWAPAHPVDLDGPCWCLEHHIHPQTPHEHPVVRLLSLALEPRGLDAAVWQSRSQKLLKWPWYHPLSPCVLVIGLLWAGRLPWLAGEPRGHCWEETCTTALKMQDGSPSICSFQGQGWGQGNAWTSRDRRHSRPLVQKTKTALEFKIHSNWILETQSLKQLCPTKGLYSYPQKSFWRGRKKGSSNFKLGPQNLLVCGSFLGLSAYYQKVKCLRLLKKDLHKLLSPASYMRLMKLEQIGLNSHPGQPCTPKNRPSQTHGAQVWVPTPTLESFLPARDVGGKPSVRVQKMLLSVDMGPVVPGLVNPDNDTETREQMGRTRETPKVSNEPTGLWREIVFAIQTSACLSPLWSLCIKKEESQTTNDLAIG